MCNSLLKYLIDSTNILRICLVHVKEGQSEFYRVIALQLRLLLCDTTFRHNRLIDISLVPRVFGNIYLRMPDKDGLFSSGSKKFPLNKWLDQTIPGQFNPETSIRQLIRRVCDQDGGAHIDVKANAGLQDIINYQTWINKLGKYIVKELDLCIQGHAKQ